MIIMKDISASAKAEISGYLGRRGKRGRAFG
jgi:hypothetical protein